MQTQSVHLSRRNSNKMDTKHHARFDFSQITNNIFLGTNLCCQVRSHIQILLDLGITAEIDLEKERQDIAPDVEVYLWLPVVDKSAPTMNQFIAGVRLIQEMVNHGKKVYVHCQYGHGRSPAMVMAYFISQGESVAHAIDIIKQARPEIHLEEIQMQALETYSRAIKR